MTISRRALLLASLATPLAATGLRGESPPLAERGPVILTVAGQVSHPSRGAVGEDDKFFAYNEVTFDAAAQFDSTALQALGVVTIEADFPKGGPVHRFTGPLLADVLAAAGASGEKVVLKALDGYQVELDLSETLANGAVLALERDGQPFALGGYGPTHLVFPRAERPELADMVDDNWIWSIYFIRVE